MCASPPAPKLELLPVTRSIFKAENRHITLEQMKMYTLTTFQEKLRQSKTKHEYCAAIRGARDFYRREVPVHLESLDAPDLMAAEVKRQAVVVDGDTHGAHVKVLPAQRALGVFCLELRHKLDMSPARERVGAEGSARADAVVLWICQSLGENRVGKQAFNSLRLVLGIDLEVTRDLMVFDTKGCSDTDPEAAHVCILEHSVIVKKINHLQLCRNGEGAQGFEMMFHVKTVSTLNLRAWQESFQLDVCFSHKSDSPYFDPSSQDKISLHSTHVPFDEDKFEALRNYLFAAIASAKAGGAGAAAAVARRRTLTDRALNISLHNTAPTAVDSAANECRNATTAAAAVLEAPAAGGGDGGGAESCASALPSMQHMPQPTGV